MVLHPQVQALMDRYAALGARPLHELGVVDARRAIDGARVLSGEPDQIASVRDILTPGGGGKLPVRIYHPRPGAALPLLVYLHGGGWIGGSIQTVDSPCRALASAASCVVASIGYRLSPETQFPGPLDDAYTAICWLASHSHDLGARSDRLLIAGDSAGGGLAAGAALLLRDRSGPPLQGQILIYPALAPSPGGCSGNPNEGSAEGLTRAEMDFFWRLYLPNPSAPDCYAAPLLAPNVSGLPPTLIVTAEHDILRAEGLSYTERLRSSGVTVTHVDSKGMVHGFFGQFGAVPAGRRILEDLSAFISPE